MVINKNWKLFDVLEKGPPKDSVKKEQLSVILHFLNAHREDAHSGSEMSPTEFAAYRACAAVLNRALDQYFE